MIPQDQTPRQFRAVLMEASEVPNAAGAPITARVADLDASWLLPHGLPQGEVLLAVTHSGLNYKEAIIYSGQRGDALRLPQIMGIDGVGTVVESAHPGWQAGDAVIINGAGLGDLRHGAISTLTSAPGDALVALPEGMRPETAAALGTAGFTAALSVEELVRRGLSPDEGAVLVTGASGGVGAIAVMLLSAAGFEVAALTGRAAENGEMLRRLGAAQLVERSELEGAQAPLQPQRWAGAVDTVGGPILANILAQTIYEGTVTCCGLAASREVTASMYPFILRGVTLAGINSVDSPAAKRAAAWSRLAADIDVDQLESITQEISMAEVPDYALQFLSGSVTGRVRIRTAD